MNVLKYKDYEKKNDIHGTVLYPAVMIAPMQRNVLEKLINRNNHMRIFDPFHGSGTALYESLRISKKLTLYGCDINPLANLITKVKLQGVSNTIDDSIKELENNINTCEYKKHCFPNITKWFRNDIIDDLSKVRESIIQIKSKQNRLYFWCMLSDLIRKYSNTRSSTYKLHSKTTTSINSMANNLIEDYLLKIDKEKNKFNNNFNDFSLYKSDVLEVIKKFDDRFFDISITSPPYGDNATTVPYGQFSMLPLFWIYDKDLDLEGWELNNYSIIDNKSLGGKNNKKISINSYGKNLIDPYIKRISERKTKKVFNFLNDYFIFLDELTRVTNKYIVMTLGNRTVDNVQINLTDITIKYLEKKGFHNIDLFSRKIPKKRIPRKISSVNNSPVNSINKEYLIVNKRI